MKVLVAYATRHGATRGIAERIAQTLRESDLDVALQPVEAVADLSPFDAFVLGSAAYNFHWLKDATQFARRNRDVLASRPVWLFSSGPVGKELVDSKGNDVLKASEPREFAELAPVIRPREEKVFFGAWDPFDEPVGIAEKLFAKIAPKLRDQLPAGDFRDWALIEAWARGIARDLQGVPALA